MNLLGNSSYKKYVSIVSGMILVLIVVSPFIKYLRVEDKLNYYLDFNEFAIETADFENSLRTMEEEQLEYVFQEYSARVKSRVETILQGEGLRLTDFQLKLNRDETSQSFGEILEMDIKAAYGSETEKTSDRIFIEDIVITKVKMDDEGKPKPIEEAPSPAEISIKNKIMDFYNIPLNNINISIQGGKHG
jgi:stage III sporulation protein AF